MHLYALDEQDNLVLAHQAEKQVNYYCRECHSVVRCRGGFFRQIHFYHIEPNRTCRQSGKSIIHLQIQHYFQKVLTEVTLEKNFSAINRIADIVWEQEKLVFEIQCSPITACEVEERNRDYQSLGYQVIWILHDQLYNKNRLTAAEYFLRESPHYFTNINGDGYGCIYDQWDIVEKGRRLKTVGYREIQVAFYRLFKEDLFSKKEYPQWMIKRIQTWPLYFSGDYLDYLLRSTDSEISDFFSEIASREQAFLCQLRKVPPKFGLWGKLKEWMRFAAFPYRLSLHMMVDRLTKN